MRRRSSSVTQAEIRRVVKGALDGGMPAGSFEVRIEGNVIRLLPTSHAAALDDPNEIERRIREGCGAG